LPIYYIILIYGHGCKPTPNLVDRQPNTQSNDDDTRSRYGAHKSRENQ